MSADHSFNSNKVFLWLFVLTALEVGWSFLPFPKWALWGGLIIFALMKGTLIFMYFMHMKFEGWIVKGLIAPTPVLIAIAVFALMPDVANNSRLVNPVGAMVKAGVDLDSTTRQQDATVGEVVTMDELGSAHAEAHGGGH